METKELSVDLKEINVIDLLLSVLRHKRLIIGGTYGIAMLTLAVCFIISPLYTATTTILPPQTSSSSAAATQLMGQLGGTASMLLGTALPTSSGDLFVGLVADNSVVDPIIDRFDLMKLYGVDTRVEMRKKVTGDILSADKDSKSGIVSISVDDTDPQRATQMANAFADGLKKVLEVLAVTDAGMRRVFFERELKKAQEQLSDAEDAMKGFQETTGTFKIDDQTAALLQGLALLKANVVAKEVQLKVMKTYAATENPDLKKAEEELNALREQLKKQEDKQESSYFNPLMPMGQIPALGVEYLRKYRNYKYADALYELVTKQYVAARMDEARESMVIQVIQPATPPDKKSKPRVVILLALSIIAGGGLFTMIALLKEIIGKAYEHPEIKMRFQDAKRSLLRP
jgi:tyrosine-protein kinase Etk/Wzc